MGQLIADNEILIIAVLKVISANIKCIEAFYIIISLQEFN